MNTHIKATGIELTPAISEYALKKISALEKYLDQNISAGINTQIEVGKTTKHHSKGPDVFRAEVRMFGAGADFYAVKEADDLYAAIDLVKDEMVREITKTKGRHGRLLRRGQRAVKDILKRFRN